MEPGTHWLPFEALPQIEAQLVAKAWQVFSLPERIVSKANFFDAVRCLLPLDPPLVSNRSWDALSDSLWQGIYGLPNDHVAIIWKDPNALATAAPSDHRIAMDILHGLTESLADPTPTLGKTKALAVILGQ